MKDYLLFIDTEASGLPKKWDLPYFAENNWPFAVQISWIIFTKAGQKVKHENHFIKENDFKVTKPAARIHGITEAFRSENGKSRKEVIQLLSKDIALFQPLVIGHFMEFDYHILGADFYRTGIENPLKKEMTFCTMLATTHLIKNPGLNFFRLGQLYEFLFNVTLHNQHDALIDAKATAECFFELVERREINDETIMLQQAERSKSAHKKRRGGCLLPVFCIIFLMVLICYYL